MTLNFHVNTALTIRNINFLTSSKVSLCNRKDLLATFFEFVVAPFTAMMILCLNLTMATLRCPWRRRITAIFLLGCTAGDSNELRQKHWKL